jgi:hypothetical protein
MSEDFFIGTMDFDFAGTMAFDISGRGFLESFFSTSFSFFFFGLSGGDGIGSGSEAVGCGGEYSEAAFSGGDRCGGGALGDRPD